MTIHTDELLWRTRGRHWEYCFVLVPEEISQESWWTFYQEVMRQVPDSEGSTFAGYCRYSDGRRIPFFASVFLDTQNVDAAGRSTEQFVVWFPKNCDLIAGRHPLNLARGVTEHLSPILEKEPFIAMKDEATGETPEQLFRLMGGLSCSTFLIETEEAPANHPVIIVNLDEPESLPMAGFDTSPRLWFLIGFAVIAGVGILGSFSRCSVAAPGDLRSEPAQVAFTGAQHLKWRRSNLAGEVDRCEVLEGRCWRRRCEGGRHLRWGSSVS